MEYEVFKKLRMAYLQTPGNIFWDYNRRTPWRYTSRGVGNTKHRVKYGQTRYDEFYATSELLPFNKGLVRGDIIETYDGREFKFMNKLMYQSQVSCLLPGTKAGRHYVNIGFIYKVNGKPISKMNGILLDLLSL